MVHLLHVQIIQNVNLLIGEDNMEIREIENKLNIFNKKVEEFWRLL